MTRINDKVKRFLARFLNQVCVTIRQQELENNDSNLPNTTIKKIVVLGIGNYSEEVTEYNVVSYFQLYKILKLEQKVDDRKFVFQILPEKHGKRFVRKVFFDITLLERYKLNPWIILPESWLLQCVTSTNYCLQINERKFVLLGQGSECSIVELAGLLTEPEAVLEGLSQYENTTFENITEVDLKRFSHLNVVQKQTAALLPGVRLPIEMKNKWETWKFLGIGAISCGIIYLIFISFFIDYQLSSAKTKNASLTDNLSNVVDLKYKNNKKIVRLKELSGVLEQKGWEVKYWQILAPLIEKGVLVDKFNLLSTGKVLISGQTSTIKASEVLELLLENELVKAAEFLGSVSKRNEEEKFRISCEVVREK